MVNNLGLHSHGGVSATLTHAHARTFLLAHTVNKSTGYSPFQLKYGHSPRVLPYLDDSDDASRENVETREIVHMIERTWLMRKT